MNPEDRLSSRLDEDKIWRIRELTELVRACAEADTIRQDALVRAAIPVLYAHWEGYFVFSTNAYLNFVAEKRRMLSVLRDEFWALTLRRKYRHQQINSDSSLTRLLLSIRSEPDRSFKKGTFERINGQSNLSSDVLRYCCGCVGIDYEAFADYEGFIDLDLLDKRNHIAHGEALRFQANKIPIFRDKVVDLMRIVQNQVENMAHSASYMKTT
jgi:hypothetical protein